MAKKFIPGEDEFQKILDKHDLGKLRNTKLLNGGFANSAFLVNEDYVIRFNRGRDDEISQHYQRYKREAILYDLFPNKDIPAPRLVALNTTKDIVPYYYIIISNLSGDILSSAYKDLSDKSKHEIAFETGAILRKIHSIQEIEPIADVELFKNQLNWKEIFINDFNQHYELFNKYNNYLSDQNRKCIEDSLDQYNKNITDRDIPIGLLHYDFHANHVIIHNNKVTGFIDFEWTRFGDPLWDFQKLPVDFSIDQEFYKDDFLKGYGIEKMTEKELLRFKMYCFQQALWQIHNTRHGKFGFPEEAIEAGYKLIQNTINFI